jgi:hypothetical protein
VRSGSVARRRARSDRGRGHAGAGARRLRAPRGRPCVRQPDVGVHAGWPRVARRGLADRAPRTALVPGNCARGEDVMRRLLQLLQGQRGQCLSRPCTASVASVTHRAHIDIDAHAAIDADIPAALLDTSDRLLARLRDDPSALSVARRFIALACELEAAKSRGAASSGSRSSPRRPRARRARSAHAAPRRRSLRHLPAARSARPRRWWPSGGSKRAIQPLMLHTYPPHTGWPSCSRCVSYPHLVLDIE